MATSIISAFNEFQKDKVNLDSEQTKKARSSRDWLVDQIHGFPDNDTSFPLLWAGFDIFFGSFARKTKKRPLDDIDIMIGLHAQAATYFDLSDKIVIRVSEYAARLVNLCHDGTYELNSRKVINKFVSALGGVPQYGSADINRNHEAATLKLTSYDWNFDIVPCFFTSAEDSGRAYYLIPDGQGHWKKTDPRLDRDRVQKVNQRHNGKVLNVIRIMKYWNRRAKITSMPSYLLENMVLDYYASCRFAASDYVHHEVINVLDHLKASVYNSVSDPKGIQGDLNTLSPGDRFATSLRAISDLDKAKEAGRLESEGDHRASINKWREIFGPEFPTYG